MPHVRPTLLPLLGALLLAWPAAAQAQRLSVDAVADGFRKTVFGVEYGGPFGLRAPYMRRFERPVDVYVRSTARKRGRRARVVSFLRYLDSTVGPLRIRITNDPAAADLAVYVVDRKDYATTVRNDVFRSRFTPVRGRCVVRSQFTRDGISRSSAVIVSDEGEALFRRCMAEEIMQALGPLRDDPSLGRSMFNDRTRFTAPQRFDLLILRVLYDPRLQSGMTQDEVEPLLRPLVRRAMRAIPP